MFLINCFFFIVQQLTFYSNHFFHYNITNDKYLSTINRQYIIKNDEQNIIQSTELRAFEEITCTNKQFFIPYLSSFNVSFKWTNEKTIGNFSLLRVKSFLYI